MGKEPWGLEKVKNNVGKSMRESFPAIFGDNWQTAGEIYKNHYHSNNLKNLVFLEGALELIEYLHQKKIILFVVSNKVGTTLRKEAESLQVKDKFFSVIGATDANYDKPDKAPVELALQGSDLDPQKDLIWFIGDTIVDIECAYNSNCQPVLYGNGESISENFIKKIQHEKSKTLLRFSSHQEILKYFNDLN
jgi:phosphoglycolate phosphatase